MTRFPRPNAAEPFAGTTLADWLPADNVHAALRDSAAVHAERSAISFVASGEPGAPVRRLDYAALLVGVTRAANLFRSLGVGRQDVVAYLLPSLVETHFVLWGAETAGIAFPINPLLQAEEIAALARAAGVKVLVAFGPAAGTDIWAKALQVQAMAPCIQTLVKVGGGDAGQAACIDFSAAHASSLADLNFGDLPGRHDTAAYFHTGGTTGTPKLVIHTHGNQLAAAYGGAFAVGATHTDTIVNGLPMFHVAATIFCGLSMLLVGAEILILSPSGFRNPGIVENFWSIVERHRATIVGGVPTALAAVVRVDAANHDLPHVRVNISGAASLPLAIAHQVERATGKPIREVYGMTEAGGVICVDPVSRDRVLGSAGCPIPFCEVQAREVMADGSTGAVRAAGLAGMLVVRGPNVSPGYKTTSPRSSLFTGDGWLITGDIGRVDSTDRVFITGRAKDLIIRSGHNIDPLVIEDCLLLHPAVADAAAVGMPDDYAGEVPVVYVAIRPGAVADEAMLLSFLGERIAERPALPKRVFFLDRLPTTAVGKTYKPALRRDCAESHIRQVLAGEPIASLEVIEDPGRGRLARIALVQPCEMDPKDRIAAKLGNYLLTVEWIIEAELDG
jgi:fatty-acyl-CoA synthase